MGAYKKGTIINGDNVADLVIILKTFPTMEALTVLASKVLESMRQKDSKEVLTLVLNNRGFDLSSPKVW